ncbi:Zinc finger BED domain-containing protein DAYSLEEPER [Linum perenne]
MKLEGKKYKDVFLGPPTAEDWKCVRSLTKYLKFFHDLTLVASGTKYVTNHLFLKEVSRLFYHISKMERSDDEDIRNMANKMKDKVFKYWYEHEETNLRMNRLMYFAPIFDPRHIWSIITYIIPRLYGQQRGEELIIEIRKELLAMFDVGGDEDGDDDFFDDYAMVPMRVGERTELDKYLAGEREEMGEPGKPYDVLGCWKSVAHKFHVLSEMAKDILDVPISTVASES